MKSGAPGRQRSAGKRSELLSVRLGDRTKTALEAAAARNGSTVSHEAASRLDRSLEDDSAMELVFGTPENRGLAALITKLAENVRVLTGLSWRDDPFTYREFVAGVTVLLQELPNLLGLTREPEIPERVRLSQQSTRDFVESLPDARNEKLASARAALLEITLPGGIGIPAALGLLSVIPLCPSEPNSDRPLSAREFFEYPRIYRDLDLGRQKNS